MTVKLNAPGETHLKGLIDAGKYNTDKGWDFTAEDGNALLGAGGDDWKRYASVHLGEDDGATDDTKARWKYPAAKSRGDSEEVWRAGLEAVKERAAQNRETDIEDAASRLLDAIDEKEGKDTETPAEDKDEGGTEASAALPARVVRPGAARDLPRLMTRIFGTPLMIAPAKLDVIMTSPVGARLGIAASPLTSDKQAEVFKAFFDDDEDGGNPAEPSAPYDLTPDGIAILSVDGTLVYKSSWLGALSGLTGYGDVRCALDQALADPAVKGILLQVDSYGGEVNGCFDLSDAVFAARAVKPIYGVAADDSYSAAFALLSACSQVFVSRTSGVGSVGVVALHIDQSAADKAEGLKYTYIYSGDRKIDGNPHQPLSSPALDNLQAECDRLRALFAASVAKYRGLSVDDVVATQAACFFGELAVGAKFADAVGTPDDALAALRAALAVKAAGAAPAMPMGAAVEKPAALAAAAEPSKDNVVDLDAIRGKAVGEAAALHAEIVSLCALAELPKLATELITQGASLEQARARIQDARAKASDAVHLHGHIVPDAGDNAPQQASAGWESAIRKLNGGKLRGE